MATESDTAPSWLAASENPEAPAAPAPAPVASKTPAPAAASAPVVDDGGAALTCEFVST